MMKKFLLTILTAISIIGLAIFTYTNGSYVIDKIIGSDEHEEILLNSGEAIVFSFPKQVESIDFSKDSGFTIKTLEGGIWSDMSNNPDDYIPMRGYMVRNFSDGTLVIDAKYKKITSSSDSFFQKTLKAGWNLVGIASRDDEDGLVLARYGLGESLPYSQLADFSPAGIVEKTLTKDKQSLKKKTYSGDVDIEGPIDHNVHDKYFRIKNKSELENSYLYEKLAYGVFVNNDTMMSGSQELTNTGTINNLNFNGPLEISEGESFQVSWNAKGFTNCEGFGDPVEVTGGKYWNQLEGLLYNQSMTLFAGKENINIGLKCFKENGQSVSEELNIQVQEDILCSLLGTCKPEYQLGTNPITQLQANIGDTNVTTENIVITNTGNHDFIFNDIDILAKTYSDTSNLATSDDVKRVGLYSEDGVLIKQKESSLQTLLGKPMFENGVVNLDLNGTPIQKIIIPANSSKTFTIKIDLEDNTSLDGKKISARYRSMNFKNPNNNTLFFIEDLTHELLIDIDTEAVMINNNDLLCELLGNCDCSVELDGVTYRLEPCSIDATMVDGIGNNGFPIQLIPSDLNTTYSFNSFGYTSEFKFNGTTPVNKRIVSGNHSGGARGVIDIILSFSDINTDVGNYNGYYSLMVGNIQGNQEKEIKLNINLDVSKQTGDINYCETEMNGVNYRLEPCNIDASMINNNGDLDFNFKLIPSDHNYSYSFYTEGYGEGFPIYGILGGGSGAASGIYTFNLRFNDSVLELGSYNGYMKIPLSGDGYSRELRFGINLDVVEENNTEVSIEKVDVKNSINYYEDKLNISTDVYFAGDNVVGNDIFKAFVYNEKGDEVLVCKKELTTKSNGVLNGDCSFKKPLPGKYTIKVDAYVDNKKDSGKGEVKIYSYIYPSIK